VEQSERAAAEIVCVREGEWKRTRACVLMIPLDIVYAAAAVLALCARV